ncbi:MAG: YigZ family protein [Patescibacteria group bacterium]|nr:YigZ family protein [Patescibacteria group bacterium]
MSQCEKLLNLLKDKKWHKTPAIVARVYGSEHMGLARLAARVLDLKNRGYDIESRLIKGSLWAYKMN